MTITFRIKSKEYRCPTALEVVKNLRSDAEEYERREGPIQHFLKWSLDRLYDRIPPRDLDLSDRMDDETLALNYLLLCDEYGIGEILMVSSTRFSCSGRR